MSSSQNRLAQISAQVSPTNAQLQGKVCIITGAGSPYGIGRATAYAIAQQGPKAVYVTDLSLSDTLTALAEELQKVYGIVCIARAVDAASAKDVEGIVGDALTRFGRLDVFVANAGVATATRLDDENAESFMEMLRINALSVFLALKYAGKAMQVLGQSGKEVSGGAIIATASVAGLRSGAGSPEYSASKAAVINLCQTGSCQYAGTGVRVNAICPGLIETNMTKNIIDYARGKGSEHKLGQLNPTKRHAIASEVASVIAFLASEGSSYINGQAIAIDGGLSASLPIVPGRFF